MSGLPILMAELGIGRAVQRTPVGAFRHLAWARSPWVALGLVRFHRGHGDKLVTPLGGPGFAIFVGWRLSPTVRRSQFDVGVAEGLYQGWLAVLRFLAVPAIVLIFLRGIGVL